MRILKAKNVRYYFEDNHLYFHGEEETYKIKASEAEYLKIHGMLSDLKNGVEVEYCYKKYKRYRQLLDFLTKKEVLYQIDQEIFQQHRDHEYFPWLEKASLVTDTNLSQITHFSMTFPESHIATPSLKEKCLENGLNFQTNNENNLFQIWGDKRLIASYYPYINDENDIVVAPFESYQQKEVDHSIIAGKILSPFIFHALFMSAFEQYATVFIIKEDFEVVKKKKFLLENVSQSKAKTLKTEQDTITSLNALEKFIQTHHSPVSSFNLNRDYNHYLQLPIQIFTIQKKNSSAIENNYYIADVNYERLAKFAVEVLFAEALLSDYLKDISIVQGTDIIHQIKEKPQGQKNGLKRLNSNSIPEFAMIHGLLDKQNLELTFMIDEPKRNGLVFYLKDHKQNQWFKYDYPIYNKAFITLIIYTWISAYINGVSWHEAAFSKVELASDHTLETVEYGDLFIPPARKSTRPNYLNINNILDDLGYGYEIMEG